MSIDGMKLLPRPVASLVGGVLDASRFSPSQDAAPAGPAQLADAIREAFERLFERSEVEGGGNCRQRPQPFDLDQAQQPQGLSQQLGDVVQKLTDLVESLQSGQPGEWGDPHVGDGAEQPGAAQQPFAPDQVMELLQDMLSRLTGQAGQKGFDPQPDPPSPGSIVGFNPQPDPPASFGDGSVRTVQPASDSVGAGGAKVDSMMKEAEQLMQSDNKADQLKGQKMMQDAQNLFSMLSNLIKAQGDMQKAAIQNMRG